VSEVVHPFCKDAIPRRTVNQLLKRLVREICRQASVRAAHREVRGYSTLGVRFPRATHLVICCKGQSDKAMEAMRRIMERLKLTINDDKTNLCRIPQERFDFLGYTFGRCYSRETGRAYIGTRPSRKSIKRMVENITGETDRSRSIGKAEDVVGRLNRKLIGWANYFCLGQVSPAYQAINTHVTQRLRRWLCKKHKVRGKGWSRYPDQYLHEQLGLIYLPQRTRNLPWAKA